MKGCAFHGRRTLYASALIAFILLALCRCAQNSIPEGDPNDSGRNGNGSGGHDDAEWIPQVNLQITEDSSDAAFNNILAELESRNITATIIVDEWIAVGSCISLRDADLKGNEIMVYGRPDEPEGEVVNLEMLPYAEQEEVITDAKSAVENCLNKSVKGFRSYHFSQNEDTYDIVDSLGFDYNLSFVAMTACSLPGHENDTLPYKTADHEFWAVPMHSVGGVAFCDMPFRELSAADWETILLDEFDRMAAEKHPLLVEIHPYFSVVDQGRFNALKNFLDYAVAQKAEFITIEELVNRSR